MSIDKEETSIGAHALLLTEDNKVILQQRDTNPQIINSGLISMFGGTLKSDENIEEGLTRELFEELELEISINDLKKLGVFHKTKAIDGVDFEINVYTIENVDIDSLILKEGKSFYYASIERALENNKLTRITRVALEYFRDNR